MTIIMMMILSTPVPKSQIMFDKFQLQNLRVKIFSFGAAKTSPLSNGLNLGLLSCDAGTAGLFGGGAKDGGTSAVLGCRLFSKF
jgi:hypothetical protein